MQKLKMSFIISFVLIVGGFSANIYANATPAKLTGKQIIQKMVHALNPGGKKINDIKFIVITTSANSIYNGKTENNKNIFMYKAPDKYLQKSIDNTGRILYMQGYSKKKSWSGINGRYISEKNPKKILNWEYSYATQNPIKINHFEKYFSKFELQGSNIKVGKYDCYKVLCLPKIQYLTTPTDAVIYYVDETSFLPRKIEVHASNMDSIVLCNKYEKIHGMNISFDVATESTIKSSPLSKKTYKFQIIQKVRSVNINVKLDDSIFNLPPKESSDKQKEVK